jgi:hypothetical protein
MVVPFSGAAPNRHETQTGGLGGISTHSLDATLEDGFYDGQEQPKLRTAHDQAVAPELRETSEGNNVGSQPFWRASD